MCKDRAFCRSLLPGGCRKQQIRGNLIYTAKRLRASGEKQNKKWNDHRRIGKLAEAFIKLNEKAPCGQGAGQMNKPLKIYLTNYCLSHLQAAALSSAHNHNGQMQRKEERGGRGMTTSCLGNYHHFWHELRGLLAASLLLLNSLLCWLMMKRVHAPTPLVGLWHNVLRIPCDPASWAG